MRRIWLLGFLLGPLPAEADERRPPTLHWTRAEQAESCIAGRELAERVEALTGPVLVPAHEAELTIEGHIERLGTGGFRARITVSGADGQPRGERIIEHAGELCRDFDAALAFVIALTIDPDLELEALSRALGPAPEALEQTLLDELHADVPREPAAPAPEVAPPPEARLETPAPSDASRWELGAAAFVAGRELPRLSLGAALRLDWLARRVLSLSWWSRASAAPRELPLAMRGRVRSQAFSSALLVCARWSALRALRAGACAGPEVGLERATARGLSRSESALLSSYGFMARLDLSVALRPRLWLDAHGFATLRLMDKRFVYELEDKRRAVYTLSRTAAGGALGVSRTF